MEKGVGDVGPYVVDTSAGDFAGHAGSEVALSGVCGGFGASEGAACGDAYEEEAAVLFDDFASVGSGVVSDGNDGVAAVGSASVVGFAAADILNDHAKHVAIVGDIEVEGADGFGDGSFACAFGLGVGALTGACFVRGEVKCASSHGWVVKICRADRDFGDRSFLGWVDVG